MEKGYLFGSNSGFAGMHASPSVRTEPVVSSPASLDTNMAKLEQVSKRYFGSYERKSTEQVSAHDETLQPGPFLHGTVQLDLTDVVYDVCRKKETEHCAYEELSFSDVQETAKRVTDFPRPGGRAAVFCTAQQLALLHGLFSAVQSTYYSGSSILSPSGLKEKFMVRAAF